MCIIDSTEIFIDRPSDLKARCQTWSSYKQHNTIKILIAVTPQGTISFVSKAWEGRVSDKYITEHCGILDKLLAGDLVLADRGFTIQDSVGLHCAEVKMPHFTKGKKQLSRCEIDWSWGNITCPYSCGLSHWIVEAEIQNFTASTSNIFT